MKRNGLACASGPEVILSPDELLDESIEETADQIPKPLPGEGKIAAAMRDILGELVEDPQREGLCARPCVPSGR